MDRHRGSSRPDHPNFDLMVAVASGTSAWVERWASVLERAAIASALVEPCCTGAKNEDFVELWVDRDDAEEARRVLRATGRGTARLL